MGLPLEVFTLYGKLDKFLSPEMQVASEGVSRLGIPILKRFPMDLLYWWKQNRQMTSWLFRTVPVRRWRSLVVAGENMWAFFCGFTLARQFEGKGIEHLHAPWSDGPATAAWVASSLTGIPFSFTGRAADIYPPDGALAEKIYYSTFVRTNTMANVNYLKGFADKKAEKIHLTYNGYPLKDFKAAPVNMEPPYRITALGRFARFKGYDILLRACKILENSGLDFHLTLAGSGARGILLKSFCRRLGLKDRVSFPGFITHDRVSELLYSSDVFVMPSIIHSTGERDGIPNVIMEALLHRLPVVASNVSGISEVIRDGETGLLVPPRNPSALAQALTEMTRDRKAALEMAEKGRSRVLTQFDPERNHREVLQLYQEQCISSGDDDSA